MLAACSLLTMWASAVNLLHSSCRLLLPVLPSSSPALAASVIQQHGAPEGKHCVQSLAQVVAEIAVRGQPAHPVAGLAVLSGNNDSPAHACSCKQLGQTDASSVLCSLSAWRWTCASYCRKPAFTTVRHTYLTNIWCLQPGGGPG